MKLIIILSVIIVIQLIVIFLKDRFLQLLSIIFGMIALMPIVFSTGLYFGEAPVVEYKISSKHFAKEGDKYIYDFDISILSKKNSVILNEAGIAKTELMEGESSVGLHPKYDGVLKILGFRDGDFFIGGDEKHLLDKGMQFTCGYRIIAEKEKDKVLIKYLLSTKTDTAKLGALGIFQPNYEYKLAAIIPIDFKNLNSQKGYFEKVE